MRALNTTGNSSGENGTIQDISTQVNTLYASVQKALDSGIVSEELKNTPLIIFFLTELAIDGKLETIRNRADLYEKMVEKILFEHQGEKELPTQKRA